MSQTQAATNRRNAGTAIAPSRRIRKAAARALPYLGLLPALITFVVLLGYPVVRVLVTSVQHYGLRELINGGATWAGFDNYAKILADPDFIDATVRTFALMLACVVLTVFFGTLVALLLDRLNRVVRLVLSVAMILAWATPTVTGVVVFQWLFDSKLGVVNWAISSLGIFGSWLNHSWFATGPSTFAVIILEIVWQAIPFVAFSLYAGLLTIPRDLNEAARVDGATERQLFRHVTLPSLRPLLMMLTFLSTIWDFKVFTQVYAMRQGGPDGETVTLSLLAYIKGRSQSHYDLAAAISVIMIVLLLVVLVPYIRRMVQSGEEA